jgi:hypothetical protein
MANVDLHPDVVRAIRDLANTSLGRKFDAYSRKRYGVSGGALAAKQTAGEFGGRSVRTGRGVVSSAGARGPGQFIPSTRQEMIKRFGIDPWRSDKEAIQALMRYDLEHGVGGYNPGMPTYTNYVLGQKVNQADLRAIRGGSSAASGTMSLPGPSSTDVRLGTKTIPGQSFAGDRKQAAEQLLLGGNFSLSNLLNYKRTLNSLQDVPAQTVPGDITVHQHQGQDVTVPLGGGQAGSGVFHIAGADPQRLKPELVSFAKKVARVFGRPLTGDSGATHSKYTVNGNVSEHSTGNATDIPATGQQLIRMGRAALIAAGMPRAQALKQTGGLFNVGSHQIIFNTHEGGDHTNHLHISTHAR